MPLARGCARLMPMAARSLRIALVSYHTSPFEPLGTGEAGGMNVVIAHHAQELAARGHEVEILTRRADTSSPEVENIAPRLRLRYLPAGEPRRYPKGELNAFVSEFSRAMRELARRDGVAPRCRWDLVHAHHWMSALAAEETVIGERLPLVFSYHSIAAPCGATLADGEPAENPARLAGEERAAQLAHRVVAVSQYEAATVAERYAACSEQITVLLPGVDCDMFHPLAEDPPGVVGAPPVDELLPEGPYLAVAARLQPLKGIDLAIEAVARVEPKRRPPLVISGTAAEDYSGYESALREGVARLGLHDDVRFIGACARGCLARTLRRSLAVLVPSHTETFGLIALEAAASGVPVIASEVSGLREAVVHGKTGLLVPNRDPASWAAAIESLVNDPDYAARLGDAGRRRALTLSWQRAVDGLEKVYDEVVEEFYA
ncbi:glycosyltransferase [Actinobaculum sp. 352]|nr:glycosyltransferase [Actinobaculum sp. 352]